MKVPDNNRVLIFNENSCHLEMVQESLQKRGYSTVLVKNKRKVLDAIQEFAPSVALIDLHLINYGDLELLREIWEITPAINFVVTTSSTVLNDGLNLKEQRNVGVLREPYDLSQLLDAIQQAFGNHKYKPMCLQLKQRESNLRGNLMGGVIQTNEQGIVTAVNPNARDLLGLSDGYGPGKPLAMLLSLEKRSEIKLEDLKEGEWEVLCREAGSGDDSRKLSLRGFPLLEDKRYAGSLYLLEERRSEKTFRELLNKYK